MLVWFWTLSANNLVVVSSFLCMSGRSFFVLEGKSGDHGPGWTRGGVFCKLNIHFLGRFLSWQFLTSLIGIFNVLALAFSHFTRCAMHELLNVQCHLMRSAWATRHGMHITGLNVCACHETETELNACTHQITKIELDVCAHYISKTELGVHIT